MTFPNESSEVKVTIWVASNYEGRSERRGRGVRLGILGFSKGHGTWGQASVIRYLHNFYLDALAAVERDGVKSLSLN